MAEQYPTLRAGQKVTGTLLASMMPRTVRKVSLTARTATSATADPELQITVEASAVYVIEGEVFTNGTVANDDLVAGMTGPTGCTGTWSGTGRGLDTGGLDEGDFKSSGTVIGTTVGVGSTRSFGTDDAGSGSPSALILNGMLITSTTAGTLSFDWCVFGGGGSTVTVYEQSFLKLTRIA